MTKLAKQVWRAPFPQGCRSHFGRLKDVLNIKVSWMKYGLCALLKNLVILILEGIECVMSQSKLRPAGMVPNVH
jgi:hypothetical protein